MMHTTEVGNLKQDRMGQYPEIINVIFDRALLGKPSKCFRDLVRNRVEHRLEQRVAFRNNPVLKSDLQQRCFWVDTHPRTDVDIAETNLIDVFEGFGDGFDCFSGMAEQQATAYLHTQTIT